MSNPFFERPILNSPYGPPSPHRHWELDAQGQPTQRILETRRRAEFITPIPRPQKRKRSATQEEIVFDEGQGISTADLRLYKSHCGPVTIASRDDVCELLRTAAAAVGGHKFGLHFLLTEWDQVVDAWQLESWDAYRDVARLGRKTRLPEAQRAILWSIFERVHRGLNDRKLSTHARMFTALAAALPKTKHPPFDFAIVDEAQDISVAHLRFFAALGADRPNALFFAGDLGQRIFQQPFSWKALGVDIRGRSRNLRVNYRTSHQIRMQADRLLGPEVNDADGNREDRSDTISVFNGPPPVIRVLPTEADEIKSVGAWLAEISKRGVLPHEFGVFVRSAGQLDRAHTLPSTHSECWAASSQQEARVSILRL